MPREETQDIIIMVGGKPTAIGHFYPDRLPFCRREGCANRIPLKRIEHSMGLKNAEALYCSRRCAVSVAQAAERERERNPSKKKSGLPKKQQQAMNAQIGAALKKMKRPHATKQREATTKRR